MAYDVSKLTKLGQMKSLAERIKNKYATKAELATVSSRVDDLETAGGEPNVIEGVKVNGAALAIANKMVDILIAESTNNGKIKVNNVDVAIHGLAALAYKANVSENELAAALKTKINSAADSGDLDDLESLVDILIGSDSGKSVREIANEELTAQLVPQDAQDALDTLEEIAAWIQDHPDDAAAMNTAITALQTLTAGNWGNSGTIKGYIDAAITAIQTAADNRFLRYEDNASTPMPGTIMVWSNNGNNQLVGSGYSVNSFVVSESGKGLSTNDYTTAEKNKLAGIAANATKVEASNTNGSVKINGTDTVVYTLPSDVVHGAIATDTEVNEMITEVLGAATT